MLLRYNSPPMIRTVILLLIFAQAALQAGSGYSFALTIAPSADDALICAGGDGCEKTGADSLPGSEPFQGESPSKLPVAPEVCIARPLGLDKMERTSRGAGVFSALALLAIESVTDGCAQLPCLVGLEQSTSLTQNHSRSLRILAPTLQPNAPAVA